jgi:hypothetical protein
MECGIFNWVVMVAVTFVSLAFGVRLFGTTMIEYALAKKGLEIHRGMEDDDDPTD